ncbi:MAG: TonB-dependent receptor plug domain-containing protein, partial [bacterium]
MFAGSHMMAQEEQVSLFTAKLIDQSGEPVSNALISASEGSREVKADENGQFSIGVTDNDVLRIQAEGFRTELIHIDSLQNNEIVLTMPALFMGEKDKVAVPFGDQHRRHITGSISTLDPSEVLKYDARQSVLGALNGRVPGLYGNQNLHGLGNSLIVIDGIPRNDANYLNLSEIESISVLKDINARILYGSQADNGVILIKTKRGIPYKKHLGVRAEFGVSIPVRIPEYLSSADYMELYNEALLNDNQSTRYTTEQIENTRNGNNPVRYPDIDYYDSDFLKNSTQSARIITETYGGNDKAQYYATLGWNYNNSLLNVGEAQNERWDKINIRGNVDYQINNWLKASLDAVGVFDIYKGYRLNDYGNGPNNFWASAATMLPNYYPILIPTSFVNEKDIIESAKLVNETHLLGGTSEYNFNIYGDLTRNGSRQSMQRTAQISPGLYFDLNSLVEGLTAKTTLHLDLYNDFIQTQNNEYSVYEPLWLSDQSGQDSLIINKIGIDRKVSDPSLSTASFYRRIGFFSYINYNKTFGTDHQVDATLLNYLDEVRLPNQIHNLRHLHYGLRLNHFWKMKYMAEFNAVLSGSPRFSNEEKYALSPSAGLGWVVSEEDFMSDVTVINYLKIRASAGLLQTDANIDEYYLYKTSFQQNGYFYYNYGNFNNQPVIITAYGNPDVSWEKQREVNLGFEALLMDKKLYLEGSFFSVLLYDELVKRSNYYPAFL